MLRGFVCRVYQSFCVRAVVCVWSVAPMMLLCSVCRIYQGFDIWAVVCAGMWPLWCYSVLFVGYIKALISELWSVFGVWSLWCYSVLFIGYIKALISGLWSVLECGPYDVTLFSLWDISRLWYLSCGLCWSVAPMMIFYSVCRVYQGVDIWVLVCVGVWPLWCYSVLFVGYIRGLISELWSVLKCGPYDVTLFCL